MASTASGGALSRKKKRRVEAPASAAAPRAKDGALPAELWADVLGYLYFDDVLMCNVVSKIFLRDVARQVKHLCVRYGASMDLAPGVVERFGGVRDVYIDLLQVYNKEGDRSDPDQEDYESHGYYFDCAALLNTVSFLARLPKLLLCFVGRGDKGIYSRWDDGFCSKRGMRGVAVFDGYDGDQLYCYESDAIQKLGWLIREVCEAYRTGSLSDKVEFYGLVNSQGRGYGHCAFRCDDGESDDHSSNSEDEDGDIQVACRTCEALCASFPLIQVLGFEDDEVPCISGQKRIDIVRSRDEEHLEDDLTKLLLSHVKEVCSRSTVCQTNCFAPYRIDHEDDVESSHVVKAIGYSWYYDRRMKLLISNGANAKDPEIQELLLKEGADTDPTFVGGKRVITKELYTELRKLGFPIDKNDCVIYDGKLRYS